MICISINQESRRLALADLLNAGRQCDLIEIRLDRFAKSADVAELLHEAGVFVPDPAPKTPGNCMTIFFGLWQEGRVRVTRHRDGLG